MLVFALNSREVFATAHVVAASTCTDTNWKINIWTSTERLGQKHYIEQVIPMNSEKQQVL
jgi:hypothetical protein